MMMPGATNMAGDNDSDNDNDDNDNSISQTMNIMSSSTSLFHLTSLELDSS